jgi:hypothetical protein
MKNAVNVGRARITNYRTSATNGENTAKGEPTVRHKTRFTMEIPVTINNERHSIEIPAEIEMPIILSFSTVYK